MRSTECEFEADVLTAVLQCRWPAQASDELRAHVAQCAICSDVATVAGAVDDLREWTQADAVLPDAGSVLWRAQMRMRREAVQAAGRPITAAQVVAFACAVGLAGACFGATSEWFQAGVKRISSMPAQLQVGSLATAASGMMADWGVWILLAVAVLLLLPAGVCLAVLRD